MMKYFVIFTILFYTKVLLIKSVDEYHRNLNDPILAEKMEIIKNNKKYVASKFKQTSRSNGFLLKSNDQTNQLNKSQRKYFEFANETARLLNYKPLKNSSNYILFWRPQKVGSSTLLSIFLSYGYRYNEFPRAKLLNSFCEKIYRCYEFNNSIDNKSLMTFKYQSNRKEHLIKSNLIETIDYKFSINHELCNTNYNLIYNHLSCAFKMKYIYNTFDLNYSLIDKNLLNNNDIKEVFIVRNPLSRMISIYYFWGELFKLRRSNTYISGSKITLGNAKDVPSTIINGGIFTYHGDESTVPNESIAIDYVKKFPLFPGMPGPSFTYTAFADSPSSAIEVINSNRIMCLVLERLDESLIVLSYYLNWSIADMVVTLHRKSLSSHPKASQWPINSIKLLNQTLQQSGEYDIYYSSNKKLDERINNMIKNNYPFYENLQLLKDLRTRVTQLCLSNEYLQKYKLHLQNEGLQKHFSENRLRDADNKYEEGGHSFSLNGEILYSYDVCGNCEAHALLIGYNYGISKNISNLPTLNELHIKYNYIIHNNIDFIKCPRN